MTIFDPNFAKVSMLYGRFTGDNPLDLSKHTGVTMGSELLETAQVLHSDLDDYLCSTGQINKPSGEKVIDLIERLISAIEDLE